jgi:hypothetical protein
MFDIGFYEWYYDRNIILANDRGAFFMIMHVEKSGI